MDMPEQASSLSSPRPFVPVEEPESPKQVVISASQQVKQEMLQLIESHAFLTASDYAASLHKIVGPIDSYFRDNAAFQTNCQKIADAIIMDRNGDCAFDMEDLEMIVKDVPVMMEIAKAVALLTVSLRELNLKYICGAAELLMLKLLMYIFVIVLPQRILTSSLKDPSYTGEPNPLSTAQQKRVVEIVMLVYSFVVNSRVAKRIFKKVISFFHKRAICLCCTVYDDAEDTTAAKLPTFVEAISAGVDKNRDIVNIKKKLLLLNTSFSQFAVSADHVQIPSNATDIGYPEVVFQGDL